MRERRLRGHWRLLVASSVGWLLQPGSRLSVEEQIQAAADQYEADVRAAGTRYDVAMACILTGLRAEGDSQPDHEPTATEPGDPGRDKPLDTVPQDAK